MKEEFPFKECISCKVLDDCPCPEISDDLLGTPLPPCVCPKPIDVMRRTTRKHKLNKSSARN
jgi:hypothetical protein